MNSDAGGLAENGTSDESAEDTDVDIEGDDDADGGRKYETIQESAKETDGNVEGDDGDDGQSFGQAIVINDQEDVSRTASGKTVFNKDQ